MFMKQMKFFLVALLTVVMGVSVTSCMNGDDNTQVSDRPIIGKVKDNFLNLTFTSLDGYTFKSKNTVDGTSNLMTNDYILAICNYDTSIDIDPSTNTINATVSGVEKISGNAVVETSKTEDGAEGAIYKSNRGVINIDNIKPLFIDNYNLLIPIQYFAYEKRTAHTFKLVYYSDESEMAGKTTLKVYLRHTSTEDQTKETKYDYVYRVFNLNSALRSFKTLNGSYPTKIVIEAEINTGTNKVPESTNPTSVDYAFKE